jgi:hypothetical protein
VPVGKDSSRPRVFTVGPAFFAAILHWGSKKAPRSRFVAAMKSLPAPERRFTEKDTALANDPSQPAARHRVPDLT